jgi:hypothetical protein
MFIQVRSLLLSQEWEVMVEPSAEASLPTRMLVQLSDSMDGCGRTGEKDRATRQRNPSATVKHLRVDRSGCIGPIMSSSFLN